MRSVFRNLKVSYTSVEIEKVGIFLAALHRHLVNLFKLSDAFFGAALTKASLNVVQFQTSKINLKVVKTDTIIESNRYCPHETLFS